MARKPGTPKTGGRKKGTPNKITSETREIIHRIISDNFQTFQADLSELEPNERLNILIKLLPYSIPKAESKQDIEITDLPVPVIKILPEGMSIKDCN